jgi:dolichol-phosphate mannosyltransferase
MTTQTKMPNESNSNIGSSSAPSDANRRDVSIVVPAFNEAECLPLLASELLAVLNAYPYEWEVILVDDGSTDRTASVMKDICANAPRWKCLHLARNSGQSAALAAGFRAARYAVTVAIDADLQNDPWDIPRLVSRVGQFDCISGFRQKRLDGWLRRVQSRWANRVRRFILDDGVTDSGCTLKAYRTSALQQVPLFRGFHRFLPALLAMQGARILEMSVNHRPRAAGTSKVRCWSRSIEATVDLVGIWWLKSRALRSLSISGHKEDVVGSTSKAHEGCCAESYVAVDGDPFGCPHEQVRV